MQLRLIGRLAFLALCNVAVVAQTSAPNTPKPPETPSAVHRLYFEDQEDTKTINIAMFSAGKWPRETMHPRCP